MTEKVQKKSSNIELFDKKMGKAISELSNAAKYADGAGKTDVAYDLQKTVADLYKIKAAGI